MANLLHTHTTTSVGMPIPELVELVAQAQRALENGDMKVALDCNARAQEVGFSLRVTDGEVYLYNETANRPQAAREVVIDEAAFRRG